MENHRRKVAVAAIGRHGEQCTHRGHAASVVLQTSNFERARQIQDGVRTKRTMRRSPECPDSGHLQKRCTCETHLDNMQPTRLSASARRDRVMSNQRSVVRCLAVVAAAISALSLVGCGNGTRPAVDGAAGDAVGFDDVTRRPNSALCQFFESTDGGELRLGADRRPTQSDLADPVFCHPNMLPGQPCRAYNGAPGVCVDFEYESSGRFSEFSRANRVALYCRRADFDPCEVVIASGGRVTGSDDCEAEGNCVRVPNPLPGRRQYVCFPPVCN
jgi:hypothetical protein